MTRFSKIGEPLLGRGVSAIKIIVAVAILSIVFATFRNDLAFGVESISSPSSFDNAPLSRRVAIEKVVNMDADRKQEIKVPNGVFAPKSEVGVTLYSDPIDLGNYITADDGSLNLNIDIPESTTVGHHVVLLKGETFSGESASMYGSVTVINNSIERKGECALMPGFDEQGRKIDPCQIDTGVGDSQSDEPKEFVDNSRAPRLSFIERAYRGLSSAGGSLVIVVAGGILAITLAVGLIKIWRANGEK